MLIMLVKGKMILFQWPSADKSLKKCIKAHVAKMNSVPRKSFVPTMNCPDKFTVMPPDTKDIACLEQRDVSVIHKL